ncbi:MAG: YihY/virulence factor BrkB family protein [Smithellaceae bacterium]
MLYAMMNRRLNMKQILRRLYNFLLSVVRDFINNQGLLLSGAVAYYALLSIVPLSLLVLVVLTHFIGKEQLIITLSTYLGMVMPGYEATLIKQMRSFLEHRHAVGLIGFIIMLFFSSIAFSVLEKAMSVIFSKQIRIKRRNFFISAIIPYVYIFIMALGLLLVSFIVGAIETLESERLTILGWSLNIGGITGVVLYILGILGEMLMFTSFYLVMPEVRVKFRYSLIGGIAATILWEITRRVLIWYYAVISMVNLIYGSIAIAVVTLLSIEVVATILLLGAQVIAELGYKADELTKEDRSGF